MIQFTIEIEIARSPAEVFAYVTDPAKLETWQTSTISAVSVDGGPLRLGARVREAHRAPGGKKLASLVEVSEYEQDHVLGVRTLEGALPIHGRMTFEPSGLGARVHFDAEGELSGSMRLLEPFLRLALKREFAGYCRTLKQVLEKAPAAT